MSLTLEAETPPLREEGDGAVRIGTSRVLLEIVIHAFQYGATPEDIAQSYPTVSLTEVYAVILYYLRHQDEVEKYLARRGRQAEEIRAKIEARQGPLTDLRERLLARQKGEAK